MTAPRDHEDASAYLPHRPPFLFLTHVRSCERGCATAVWHVAGDEDFLRGHFPEHPIVPGALLGEALAQAAGVALASAPDVMVPRGAPGFIARLELRFHLPVRPPATIVLRAQRTGGLATLHQFDVAAMLEVDGSSGGRLVSGSLVLSVPGSRPRDELA